MWSSLLCVPSTIFVRPWMVRLIGFLTVKSGRNGFSLAQSCTSFVIGGAWIWNAPVFLQSLAFVIDVFLTLAHTYWGRLAATCCFSMPNLLTRQQAVSSSGFAHSIVEGPNNRQNVATWVKTGVQVVTGSFLCFCEGKTRRPNSDTKRVSYVWLTFPLKSGNLKKIVWPM